MPSAVLYISYDGMLEPLGQSQVLGYLEHLAKDYTIHLISFEKERDRRDNARMSAMRQRLASKGICWRPLAYHKTPTVPATAYDIAIGTLVALGIVWRHGVGIVHARSYVPALMALTVKKLSRAKFIFDMRGFWADERVDGGLWPEGGRLYRAAKRLERRFLLNADHVVTLTHASHRIIAKFDYLQARMPPVSVITTCADLDRFRPHPVDPNRPLTFGYVGSVGTWYLFDETLAVFRAIARRRPKARLLVVNRNEHEAIRAAVVRAGIDPERLELVAAEHREVPALVSRMHIAAALIRPCFSKLSSAPTKLAEYLGCGVPSLGNHGVGDVAEILEDNGVGVAMDRFTAEATEDAATRLLALADDPKIAERCRETAQRLFSLKDGVDAYRTIYAGLTKVQEAPTRQARSSAA